eukprot:TRINITY_DN8024_c0_g1_i2.p1 TRINITY_DN8024_c0_g1~~TRINITY_DN8024_c0_g1_i2.p1  ORF type:complete len:433 (+),score=29.31 TRINITY_DN8024_c0_g1_i2:26-1300(+)
MKKTASSLLCLLTISCVTYLHLTNRRATNPLVENLLVKPRNVSLQAEFDIKGTEIISSTSTSTLLQGVSTQFRAKFGQTNSGVQIGIFGRASTNPNHFWIWAVGTTLQATHSILPAGETAVNVTLQLEVGNYTIYILHEYNSSNFAPLGPHIHNCPITLPYIGRHLNSALGHKATGTMVVHPRRSVCSTDFFDGRWLLPRNAACNWDRSTFPEQGILEACGYKWHPYTCTKRTYSMASVLKMLNGWRIFMTGDSMIETLSQEAPTLLGPAFGAYRKCHSLCQRQAKWKVILAFMLNKCKHGGCILLVHSDYKACLEGMLDRLATFRGIVIWKDISDAHRHIFSKGVCSIQYMTHERISRFNAVLDSVMTRRNVPILRTYNMTRARFGLKPRDVRHFSAEINQEILQGLLHLVAHELTKRPNRKH